MEFNVEAKKKTRLNTLNMLDSISTSLLAKVVSQLDYDSALSLCHTSRRFSNAIRQPKNDAAMFKPMALGLCPWAERAMGGKQSWRDLAYELSNLGPDTDAETWKEATQWTLCDPNTDLGLRVFAQHPAQSYIVNTQITRHENERISPEACVWGGARACKLLHQNVSIDFSKQEAYKVTDSRVHFPEEISVTRDKNGKWWVQRKDTGALFEIPVHTNNRPVVRQHNGQTFVFELTIDIADPDTAMSNLHVIDWENHKYYFLLALAHQSSAIPIPYLGNGFLYIFFDRYMVKFNVDLSVIRVIDNKGDGVSSAVAAHVPQLYFVNQYGLPQSIKELDTVGCLWGRFAKLGNYFLDMDHLTWFELAEGTVHAMLHRTHHLWSYTDQVLQAIVDKARNSGSVVSIEDCLKKKKKKSGKKKKGGATKTAAEDTANGS